MKKLFTAFVFVFLIRAVSGQTVSFSENNSVSGDPVKLTAQILSVTHYTGPGARPDQFNVNLQYQGSETYNSGPVVPRLYIRGGLSWSMPGAQVGYQRFGGSLTGVVAFLPDGTGRYYIILDIDIAGAIQTQVTVYADGNYNVGFNYTNNKSIPVDLHFFQDGQDIGAFTVPAGSTVSSSFPVTSASDVTMMEKIPNIATDNSGNWVNAGGTTDRTLSGAITPGTSPTARNLVTPSAADGGYGGFTVDSLDKGPIVWDSTQTGTDLDGGLYRAGVNKIVGAIESASPTSGGGSSVDMGPTNAKLDTLHSDIAATNSKSDALHADNLVDGDAPVSAVVDTTSPGTGETSVFDSTKVLALPGKMLPTVPVVTMPSSTSNISYSTTFRGITLDFGCDLSQFSTPIGIFKAIVRAVLALWFFFLVVRAVRDSVAG